MRDEQKRSVLLSGAYRACSGSKCVQNDSTKEKGGGKLDAECNRADLGAESSVNPPCSLTPPLSILTGYKAPLTYS